MYKPKFFTPKEWRCKCGKCKTRESYAPINDQVLVRLDLIRAALNAPITITSGWRCQAHNATVGGADRSYHMQGRAVDVTADDFAALVAMAERIGGLYLYKFTELRPNLSRRYLHLAC